MTLLRHLPVFEAWLVAKASLALRKWLNLQESQDSAVQLRSHRVPADRFDIALMGCPGSIPGGSALRELPYEWLFSAAAEPILIVAGVAGTVVAANPAAAALLCTSRRELIGNVLHSFFEPAGSRVLQGWLERACRAGSAAPITVRVRNGGVPLCASVSLVRVPPHAYLLVRLSAQAQNGRPEEGTTIPSMVLDAIDGASIGFLMTDAELHVEYANRAFITMLELDSLHQLRGTPLTRWVKITSWDFAQLRAQMSQRHALTLFSTVLRSSHELMRDVELHAVAVPDEHAPCWAFSVRPRDRLN